MMNFNLHLIECHENSKAAQMVAGTHGVVRVGLHYTATVRRPCTSFFRGIPEHTGVVRFI